MTAAQSRYATFGAIAVAGLLVFAAFAAGAQAQENAITFPVAELGGCSSKDACRTYCDNLSHVNECVAFAESHGLMSAEEAQQARAFAKLGGKGPGGCASKDSCEAYCEDTAHMRACLDFARSSGLMGEAELQEAEKVAAYVEAGGTLPGGCRGERECRAYCEEGDHTEECVAFALKAGFMSAQEAEIFKKTGGKGPGGCVGRQCEAYCEDEQHREQCIAFALEHGLMSEEERRQMEEGRQKAMEALESAPPEVLSCIEQTLGAEKMAELRRGEGFAGPALGEVLPRCFREVMGEGGQGGPFGAGSQATDCMRQVFGDDFEEKMQSGELDPGARDTEIRECMQAQYGEGSLNDAGQWERRPPEGMLPPGDDQQYGGERDAIRQEMEARMRAQMEAQMRSMPPPGSFERPPEDMPMPPEGWAPPSEPLPPGEPQSEPVSMVSLLFANVLPALERFLGLR